MSQITPSSQYVRTEHDPFWRQRLFNLSQATNAGIDFGVSTQTSIKPSDPLIFYQGNMAGQWRNVTSPVAPDTEFAIAHDLGRIPSWYWYNISKAGILYQLPNTGTAWTTTNIYLKCNVASAVIRLFVG